MRNQKIFTAGEEGCWEGNYGEQLRIKKNDIENCTCFYFENIIKIEGFDLDNILIDEKPYENILVYDISHNTWTGTKPLCIRFDKLDLFVKVFDGARYLVSFGGEKYDLVSNRIRYFIGVKMILHMLFLIIMKKSKFIHTILCPYKNITFS